MEKQLTTVIEQLKAGKQEAADEIVNRYQDMLFRLLLRFVGDRHEAEDLLQETFVRIVRSIHRYNHSDRFHSWVCRIATNLAYDHLRSCKRKQIVYTAELKDNDDHHHSNPQRAFEAKEINVILTNAVNSLPVEQRQVFLLREETGLSFKEISHILNIPLNTALGRMHYAVEKLRNQLERSL